MKNLSNIKHRFNQGVLAIELDRPEKRNALNRALLVELSALIHSFAEDPELRVVTLGASSTGIFCAGADIKEMQRADADANQEFARLAAETFNQLSDLAVPVVAWVDGAAMGGGLELLLACDMVLCSSSAVFALPEVSLGLIPCFGGLLRLPQKIGDQRARFMILSGSVIDAAKAQEYGLVAQVYESRAALQQGCSELSRLIACRSSHAIGLCKEVLANNQQIQRQQALVREQFAFKQACLHPHKAEGTEAFLAKRPALFTLHSLEMESQVRC